MTVKFRLYVNEMKAIITVAERTFMRGTVGYTSLNYKKEFRYNKRIK